MEVGYDIMVAEVGGKLEMVARENLSPEVITDPKLRITWGSL